MQFYSSVFIFVSHEVGTERHKMEQSLSRFVTPVDAYGVDRRKSLETAGSEVDAAGVVRAVMGTGRRGCGADQSWGMKNDGPAMKPVWSTIKKHPIADLVLFSMRAECVSCSPQMPPRLARRGPGVPTPVWFVLPVNSMEWA